MKRSQPEPLKDIWKGALAGFAATAPMTVAMWAVDRRYKITELRLPPEQITRNVVKRSGLHRFLNETGKKTASWVAHFGYGAAIGAAYPMTAERAPLHPAVKGSLYGTLIWVLSYLGWLPAAGMMRSATRQSSLRNLALVASHLVWGLVCGTFFQRLKK
jgi:uncharacterized membrane protein YagU involved in acid resistance